MKIARAVRRISSHTLVFPGLVVAIVFASAVTRVTSYDTWVHLSLGRWMAENGRIPRTNLLSYTEPERPVVDHQWLFQAGLYGLWRVAGIGGATLAKAAVAAAAFGFVLATARRKGAGVFVACLVTLLAAGAARFRFTLRPDVAGLLLLGVYLYLLERWRHGRVRGILWLLPLQVLWANLHGSSVLGWGLALAYAAAESLRTVLHGRLPTADGRLKSAVEDRKSKIALAGLWCVAVALVSLTLLNPFGMRVLELPFGLAEAHAASGLKELHEERASLAWADLAGRHLPFAILAALGAATLIGSALRKDVTEVGIFLGFLGVALSSARFIGVFAVAAAPIVARNLWVMAGAVASRRAPRRGVLGRGLLLSAAAALALVGVGWLGIHRTRQELPWGLGLAEGLFPEAEAAFVQARYPTGNLFNEFEHGGYISWRTRRPVFLDSRGLLAYDARLLQDYVAAWTSRERWTEVTERYGVAVAMVARPELQRMFRTGGGWALAFQGPVCGVFVRR